MTLIEQLAELVGIQSGYTDAGGQQVTTSAESRDGLLSAMGYQLDDETELQKAIDDLAMGPWLQVVEPVTIIKAEEQQYSVTLTAAEAMHNVRLYWKISCEDGEQIKHAVRLDELEIIDSKDLNDGRYNRYKLNIERLGEGYHDLELELGNQTHKSRLIVAPKTCFSPNDAADFKMWGFATQLYSLKKTDGWGIGDYGDLNNMVTKAAEQGASVIGLNPLHPLYPGNPAHRSPYSPTSRCFLNTLYIDVTEVPNYRDCKPVKTLVNSHDFQQKLAGLNSSEYINYAETAAAKYEVLELLYAHFNRNHINKETELAQEFEAFKAEMGDDLYLFATFDALYEHFRKKDFNAFGWMDWPERYQDPDSEYVQKFQNRNRRRIDYFMYLQWLADRQMAKAAKTGKDKGMALGLYLDLAVGCDGGGAEVWSDREAFVAGVGVGAPPDQLNVMGQNWGLTPINPVALKNRAYEPLIKALRSNMRHAGALRIDHVFGLMRQYWVAPGLDATEGAYITFPLDDILRVIALESRRAECVVVGEDLGTTPEGFGNLMAAAGLLSYKVLYFERWESGLFQRPDNYPEQSMVTVSTHDMPTLPGWWTERDLEWREKLNLYPHAEMARNERNSREDSRHMLVDALIDADVLGHEQKPQTNPPQANLDLTLAVQSFLARSPGRIQMIPMEDAMGIHEQVNIPGTVDEHPNWLQRMPYTVDECWQQDALGSLTEVMRRERPVNNG